MRRRVIHTILAGGTTLFTVGAAAADPASPPDTSTWLCKRCPFEQGYRASASLGAAYVSDDAARFGDATGLDEQGGYVLADAAGRQVNEHGYALEYAIEELGLDSRSATLGVRRPGAFALRLSYDELPNHVFDTTQTVFTGTGSAQLGLPENWVRAGSTSGMAAVASDLRNVNISNERKTLGLDGQYFFSQRLGLAVDYRRQERDGLAIQGASFGTTSSQLPMAIDSTTDQVDLTLRYRADRGDVTLAYYASFYNEADPGRTWANPFTAWAPGADSGRLAAPPDNSYQQLRLSGSYTLPFESVVVVSGSTGRMRQDESFLPYTINSQVATAALPRSDLDGEVKTTDLQLTVTSRPIAHTRLKAAYHYLDRDNNTPQQTWDIVEGDGFAAGSFINIPYSFTRERLNLSAQYELFRSLRVAAGYDRSELDRPHQEVREQAEDTGWGQLNWRPLASLDLTLRGGAANRDIDAYQASADIMGLQNPLLRKYNLADRDRQFGELRAAVTPSNLPVSIGATVSAANDNYRGSILGLTSSRERDATVDVSWTPREQLSLFLQTGYERIDAKQTGSESFSTPDWAARNEDRFHTAGGGLRWLGVARKTDLTLGYNYARGKGRILIERLAQAADRLPDLETTLHSVRLDVQHHWSDTLEINCGVRYEDFHTQDWSLAGVEPATVPTLLTLGADPYDYDVTVFSLSFRYFFGARALAVIGE